MQDENKEIQSLPKEDIISGEEETVEKKKKPKKSVKQEILEWVKSIAFALVIVFIIRFFLFSIVRVDGSSMYDTLSDGERLFVTVLDARLGKIERGNVVICHYPNRGFTYFVKRLVAVPGDTVWRENEVTYVSYIDDDGNEVTEALDERYAMMFPYGSPDDFEPIVLGEDQYFVVGDNRYNSHDSRDWNDRDPSNDVGPISYKAIVGRVRQVIFPFSNWRSVE